MFNSSHGAQIPARINREQAQSKSNEWYYTEAVKL